MKNLAQHLTESFAPKGEEDLMNEAKVDSKSEFEQYALSVLKKAHGDNFEQSTADKMIADLASEVEDDDWSSAVGKLQSSLSEEFGQEKVDEIFHHVAAASASRSAKKKKKPAKK